MFDVLEAHRADKAIADAEIEALIEERNAAKKVQGLRARRSRSAQELLDQGIILEDTKYGVRWKRK